MSYRARLSRTRLRAVIVRRIALACIFYLSERDQRTSQLRVGERIGAAANVSTAVLFVLLHCPGWYFLGILPGKLLNPVGGLASYRKTVGHFSGTCLAVCLLQQVYLERARFDLRCHLIKINLERPFAELSVVTKLST